MAILKYPYTNLHELNLDWLIEQLNNQDGPVRSVNGKSGMVVLTGEDIERSTSNPQTVADALQTQGTSIQTARNQIGTTPLPTTAQTVTGAIAEHETDITDINNKIGSTALPTIAQTLTGAIAENAGEIANVDDTIGSTALPTTAQTLTGAIAEHETDITNINNKIGTTALPTTAQTLTGAIAEHETDITDLSTKINGLAVRYVTWDYSIAAGLSDNRNLKELIDNNMPAGKRFLGIVGFTTNSANVVPASMRYEDTNYSWQLRNVGGSTQEAKAYAYYLCI